MILGVVVSHAIFGQGSHSMRSSPEYGILAAILLLASLCFAATKTSEGGSGQPPFDLIPDCARHCLENFIKSNYTLSECTSPSNIECLCRTQSSSGLTIGEVAYTCVYGWCPQEVKHNSMDNVYYICDSVSGALPETHTILWATMSETAQPTTTSGRTTTTHQTGDTTTTTSSTTSEHTSTTTHSSETSTSSIPTPIITTYHSPSSVQASLSTGSSAAVSSSSPSAAGKKSDHHTISPGAVIGASVVSGVAGSVIIGVGVFFCCKKWRRDNYASSDSDSFEIGGAMSEPPGFSQPSSRRPSPCPPPGSPSHSIAGVLQERSRSPGTVQINSQDLPQFAGVSAVHQSGDRSGHEPIGLALSSDSEWDTSPGTQSSQHTLAELLPDQTSRLYPKPLKWSHRPPSGETLFEEEDESQPAATGVSKTSTQRSTTPNMMAGLPANPRALKDGFPAERFLRGAGHHKPQPIQDPQTTQVDLQRRTPWPVYQARESPVSNTSNTTHDASGSSKHTSPNTLLTNPSSTAQGRILSGMTSRKPVPPPKPKPPSPGLGPPLEIVSRPRIVRRDDIKRVEIRPGHRPPSEVVTAYDPEDFWLERGRANTPPQRLYSATPYPSDVSPGAVLYPSSPKKSSQPTSERVSSTSRNLTPSRRGQDMILRVE